MRGPFAGLDSEAHSGYGGPSVGLARACRIVDPGVSPLKRGAVSAQQCPELIGQT